MKINWFSPLPPAQTDIAHYTLRFLPALKEHCDIVLWTSDPDYDQSICDMASVEVYSPTNLDWSRLNQADLTVYNIGNNPDFHRAIWQVSQKLPGIIVLHDLKLQDFFTGIYSVDNNWASYFEQMNHYYGSDGATLSQLFVEGKISKNLLVEQFPLTPLAMENSLGVICHSRCAYQKVAETAKVSVGYVPLPYAVANRANNLSTSADRDKTAPHRLIIFGYLGNNRRLEVVLNALASFPGRSKFRLDVYGEIWNKDDIVALVNDLNLKNIVTIRGFVDEATLNEALAQADLAINLRYPTMGEASGSQLRIWSHGLPSLVTPIGWYQDVPAETVHYVAIEREVEDLHRHWQAYLDNPEIYRVTGRKGKQWLSEHHSPNTCAQAIIEFAHHLQDSASPTIIQYLSQRTAELTVSWGNSTDAMIRFKGWAEAIHFLTACSL